MGFKIWKAIVLLVVVLYSSPTLSAGLGQSCNTSKPEITPSERFRIGEAVDTVFDIQTKLTWKRCAEGQSFQSGGCKGIATKSTWTDAIKQYGSDSTSWRLPSVDELVTIVERRCSHPAINATIFPDSLPAMYWTESGDAADNDYAWYIHFETGNMDTFRKTNDNFIRLVRGQRWEGTDSELEQKKAEKPNPRRDAAEKQKREELLLLARAEIEEKRRQEEAARQLRYAARTAVLGVYLGVDTIADVESRASAPQKGVCALPSFAKDKQCSKIRDKRAPYFLSANGDSASASAGSINGRRLESAKFSIDDNDFEGVFLDDVLIELKVLDQYGSHLIKEEDGPKLRKAFDGKYVKSKRVTKKEEGLGIRYFYIYDTWKDKSGTLTVELEETRPYVTNTVACLTILQGLQGVEAVRLRARCEPAMRNQPEYALTYRDDKAYLPILSELKKEEVQKKKDSEKKAQDKLNKF
jgi:hypothetical protein